MKKHDFVKHVADESGQTMSVVRRVLDATATVAGEALARHAPVSLFGLGKLKPVHRGERKARNIHTGETVMVPPATGVHFSPSTTLIRTVNGE